MAVRHASRIVILGCSGSLELAYAIRNDEVVMSALMRLCLVILCDDQARKAACFCSMLNSYFSKKNISVLHRIIY